MAWTQKAERHACFHMLSDYRKVSNTLELFGFRDRAPPYYPVAEKYFMQHGHKYPYGNKSGLTEKKVAS